MQPKAMEPLEGSASGSASPVKREAYDRAYARTRNYVRGLQARLRKNGTRVHAHVLFGPVVVTIIELAVREETDFAALTGETTSR
jgi:hypothetical protein